MNLPSLVDGMRHDQSQSDLRRPAPGQNGAKTRVGPIWQVGGWAGRLATATRSQNNTPMVNRSLYKIDHCQGQDTAYGGRAGESARRGRFIVAAGQGRFMRGGRAVSGLTYLRSSPEGTSAARGNVRHAIK
jgi:hypothetical protein